MMPQLSNVAEAFLDGFGCLGAIFEPCVRPGSTENLIQDAPDPALVESVSEVSTVGSRNGTLIWLFLLAICPIALEAAFFQFRWTTSMLWLDNVCMVAFGTLFLRQLWADVLLVMWKRWRQHVATGEKATHRV
jgi:hypothetical protein